MAKLFPTQEIGSLPKAPWQLAFLRGKKIEDSDLVHLKNWSQAIGFEADQVQQLLKTAKTPEGEKKMREAVSLFGIRFLEATGLDYVYDGEANRIEMYEHAIRSSQGFQFYGHVRAFDNKYYRKAACVSKAGFRKPYHLDEYLYVAAQAKRKVKVPVTGPYTLAEWSFNEYYQKQLFGKYSDLGSTKLEAKHDFVLDVGKEILRPNLKALVDAGAEWIQIDEPALSTRPEEVPFFVEAFNECTAGLDCKLSVHICYSEYRQLYPSILDLKNCSQLALEFANRDDDKRSGYKLLEQLKEFGETREIGLGVADVHVDTIEDAELIEDRIMYAANIVGSEKIYVNPDCGLRTRSWDVAYQKLRNISKGAELARQKLAA
jgi:5-methyltetrahydropteroyltriglutamate--homocysteine methyltransferase